MLKCVPGGQFNTHVLGLAASFTYKLPLHIVHVLLVGHFKQFSITEHSHFPLTSLYPS